MFIGNFQLILLSCFASFGLSQSSTGYPEINVEVMTGCTGTPISLKGLKADFYSYPYGSDYYRDDEFFFNGYKNVGEYLGTVNGVTNFNLDIKGGIEQGQIGNIYGKEIELSNFTMELTGYYHGPEPYSFFFSGGNDRYSFQIGANTCCPGPDVSKAVRRDYSMSDRDSQMFPDTNDGLYYPIRIVYVHSSGDIYFKLEDLGYQGDGVDFSKTMYQFDESSLPQCMLKRTETTVPAAVTVPTTLAKDGSYVSNSLTGYIQSIIVETPEYVTTSYTTRYVPWTGRSIETRYTTRQFTLD